MSIQSSINQAIGIAGALATQTPMAAAHRESASNKAALKEEKKNVESQSEILNTIVEGMGEGKEYPQSAIRQAKVDLQTAQKRIAELDPTKKNIEKYLGITNNIEKGDKISKQFEALRQISAKKRAEGRELRNRAEDSLKKAEQEAKADLEVRVQAKQKGRSKMGFETRKSMILDQYANPLEVKNER